MASMLEIVTEARIAAGKSWDRARRAASRSRETASPDALARVIEGDIIPRLLLAHRTLGATPSAAAHPAAEIPAGYADQFAAATLTEEVTPLLARVESLMAGGVSVETIYLHLLAPAARRLGSWWDEDACDFVDVTMGLWRCQEIVHALSALIPGVSPVAGAERRALFSPAPGEQHGLGALIVEEFFRREGWQTWSAPALDETELLALVAGRAFDVVGLTVSVERHVMPLQTTIASLRKVSRNPAIIVLVGGRVFTEQPALAAEIGADGTAADGALAVGLASELLNRRLVTGMTQHTT
ncbi:cobalamin B12-binding domain-containing protein [Polymorphobacter fuscus]|uniref:Cobalamin B12-binding protein n=1 Tax=Sandarakinorhabdus fusca TaxID=1439888 RepID=A0A7C9KZK7_9SPHN|nr:cobalamin-dependent protein [Polymorphobacter fuscus]KAB7644850.1 cobalamin B12-binding domain-containing protein [Polymorphobacter fuscus]MQT18128.1 cobalamin B12-binding protein [Polymorphobacter fuscus]NJC09446.1 methanogenic corrinoid protein MtbC1 [Polymorphobacter fuscus]